MLSADEFKNLIKKKHKYNAKKTIIDGISFPSKLEASFYSKLILQQRIGEVSYFLRQVPLHLPGNTKYIVDFVVFFSDRSIQYIDTTGYLTPIKKLKIKQVESLYPIEIKIIN